MKVATFSTQDAIERCKNGGGRCNSLISSKPQRSNERFIARRLMCHTVRLKKVYLFKGFGYILTDNLNVAYHSRANMNEANNLLHLLF
jgi:hypothetical protein